MECSYCQELWLGREGSHYPSTVGTGHTRGWGWGGGLSHWKGYYGCGGFSTRNKSLLYMAQWRCPKNQRTEQILIACYLRKVDKSTASLVQNICMQHSVDKITAPQNASTKRCHQSEREIFICHVTMGSRTLFNLNPAWGLAMEDREIIKYKAGYC